ncbi:MAG: type VI secretion system-associated protein TagF [Pseudomonas sp.]
MSGAGFYGKLAGRGDFVSRGLPQSFIEPWDAWLAAGMAASQAELGAGWLDAYLVSPLWRYAIAPGLLGQDAVIGVVMPSIDRVGRYFPLTIAQLLPADVDLAGVLGGEEGWFERSEALLLSTLEPEADVEAFEQAVQQLATPPHWPRSALTTLGGGLQASTAATPSARMALLAQLATEGASFWWGKGSAAIGAGILRCAGLPASHAFGRLLVGDNSPGLAQPNWQG